MTIKKIGATAIIILMLPFPVFSLSSSASQTSSLRNARYSDLVFVQSGDRLSPLNELVGQAPNTYIIARCAAYFTIAGILVSQSNPRKQAEYENLSVRFMMAYAGETKAESGREPSADETNQVVGTLAQAYTAEWQRGNTAIFEKDAAICGEISGIR